MTGDDAMKQSGRFLMDKPVIAVIGVRGRGPDRMLTHNSRSPAMLERFFMATDCISPRDAVMSSSDSPAPAWLFATSRKFP